MQHCQSGDPLQADKKKKDQIKCSKFIVCFIPPHFICMHSGTLCVCFPFVISMQLPHRTPLMSPNPLWSPKHRLRNNELRDLKGFLFSASAWLGSPRGCGTGCAVTCTIHDVRWDPVQFFGWLRLLSTHCCCTAWKQWQCVVAAGSLSCVAVPILEYFQALILGEAFLLNFCRTKSLTPILSRKILRINYAAVFRLKPF